MNTTTQPPNKDPNLGTYTPAYATWAYLNLSDEDFIKTYGFGKIEASSRWIGFSDKPPRQIPAVAPAGQPTTEKDDTTPPEAEVKADSENDTAPEVKVSPEAEGDDTNQALIDLKEMHHKTFEKQYGMKKAEYKTKHNL